MALCRCRSPFASLRKRRLLWPSLPERNCHSPPKRAVVRARGEWRAGRLGLRASGGRVVAFCRQASWRLKRRSQTGKKKKFSFFPGSQKKKLFRLTRTVSLPCKDVKDRVDKVVGARGACERCEHVFGALGGRISESNRPAHHQPARDASRLRPRRARRRRARRAASRARQARVAEAARGGGGVACGE